MKYLADLPAFLDPYIIHLYRFTGIAFVDYFLGTFLLALVTVVVGELTLSLALRFNLRHIRSLEDELMKNRDLSVEAAVQGDAESYRACNDQANDAFGRYFFTMIAYSAAALWPIPFALTWMQYRFHLVEFKLAYPLSVVWPSTGYVTTFVLLYVLARILFKNLRPYLPYFREVQKMLDREAAVYGRKPKGRPREAAA
jgi:hypothetical protein